MRTAAELVADIRHVLTTAELIDRRRRSLSAYQILERLPNREALVASFPGAGLEPFHQAAGLITSAVMEHLAGEVSFELANGGDVGLRIGSTSIGAQGPTVVFRIRDDASQAVDNRF